MTAGLEGGGFAQDVLGDRSVWVALDGQVALSGFGPFEVWMKLGGEDGGVSDFESLHGDLGAADEEVHAVGEVDDVVGVTSMGGECRW